MFRQVIRRDVRIVLSACKSIFTEIANEISLLLFAYKSFSCDISSSASAVSHYTSLVIIIADNHFRLTSSVGWRDCISLECAVATYSMKKSVDTRATLQLPTTRSRSQSQNDVIFEPNVWPGENLVLVMKCSNRP